MGTKKKAKKKPTTYVFAIEYTMRSTGTYYVRATDAKHAERAFTELDVSDLATRVSEGAERDDIELVDVYEDEDRDEDSDATEASS